MAFEIAVIAAHPDDEVLGCGATIAKHSASGEQVHVLILSEGVTSRDELRNVATRSQELATLRGCAEKAGEILGIRSLHWGGFPDNRMDGVELLDVIKTVERFLERIGPDVIYTHHGGDLNVDHVVTHRAVSTALRPTPSAGFRRLLHFEVASSTEWGAVVTGAPFVPQWFEDVSSFLPAKLAALQAYDSEMRSWPHPRSLKGVEAQARLRGACAGVDAAEAFMLGWEINRGNK